MSLPYHITIPGDPVVKKNNRPIYRNSNTGRPFLGKSQKLREAEERAVMYCNAALIDQIDCDVEVCFIFYTKTNRRIDLSNAVQLYEDALQASGILENDSQIRSLDGTRQFKDAHGPRVEIFIFPFVN